jgi:sulfoxide reductase heme-binding subunit YedZ
LALALTTPIRAKKMMGKKWKKLHRLIYLAAVTGVIHYFWQLKGNLAEPFLYSILVTVLLVFRVVVLIKNRQISRLMIPKGRVVKIESEN